jgi:predicted GIY-YIG superfamily endonuclease
MASMLEMGTVYKITNGSTEMIYIGATSKDLATRLKQHETAFEKFKQGSGKYLSSFEVLKGVFKIEAIRCYKNVSRLYLLGQERHFINENREICVNKNRPLISEAERATMRELYRKVKMRDRPKCNDCNCCYTYYNKTNHEKSRKHLRNCVPGIVITVCSLSDMLNSCKI